MEKRLTDGMDIHHAIKQVVAKHKPEFEGLFQELDEDSYGDPEEEDRNLEDGLDQPPVKRADPFPAY